MLPSNAPDTRPAPEARGERNPVRQPASFDAKLNARIRETAAPDWDEEGGRPIPAEPWDRVRDLVVCARKRMPGLPEPHPSAGGDGSQHLRWAFGGNRFDIEITLDGRARWARRLRNHRTSGEADSQAELLRLLGETFS